MDKPIQLQESKRHNTVALSIRVPGDLIPYLDAGAKRTNRSRYAYLQSIIETVARREKLS